MDEVPAHDLSATFIDNLSAASEAKGSSVLIS